MFFNQFRGLLLPEREKENKKRAPSNPGVQTQTLDSSRCVSGQDKGCTKVSKRSSIHFHSAAPLLRCGECTFGLKIKRVCVLGRNYYYLWIPRAILYFKTCLLIHFVFTHKILAGVSESCGFLERPSFKWS